MQDEGMQSLDKTAALVLILFIMQSRCNVRLLKHDINYHLVLVI